MNRFIQLKTNSEIDPEATEKIVIRQEEFYHALEYGINRHLDLQMTILTFMWLIESFRVATRCNVC